MSDLVHIVTGLVSILVISLIGLIVWKGRKSSTAEHEENDQEASSKPVKKKVLLPVDHEGPRRVIRKKAKTKAEDDEDEEDDYDPLFDEIAMPDGKIGAKKRRKLEMKAEKRIARERELDEREERKQRQAELDEKRRLEEEKKEAEEKAAEEAERLAREEQLRKEEEEYRALKATFELQEEGFEEESEETEGHNKLAAFIQYIKDEKVVLLEDLAGHFRMKTQDVINRLQDLLSQEVLVGVIDDRGKFIYITKEELESVAKFVRQRGRVTVSELVESSNRLINLSPVSS